jgi:lipopolysaccharide cholinephosphotransferase
MNSKTILNENAKGHVLSEEELAHLKQAILGILVDIDAVCRKYQLHYYLAWGTLLGAVRHHGFIPWDDDIDIFVPVSETEKLQEKLSEEFPDRYFFSGIFSKNSADPVCQLKIMLKGTSLMEIQNVGLPFPRGIGIDVFPIFSVPKSVRGRERQFKKQTFLKHAVAVSAEFHYPPKALLHSSDRKLRRYYRFRRFIGFCLAFRSMKGWEKAYRNYVSKVYPDSSFSAPDLEKKWAAAVSFSPEDLQAVAYSFEGHDFLSFSDAKKPLVFFYGEDYMIPPSEDKKEKHILAELNFGAR